MKSAQVLNTSQLEPRQLVRRYLISLLALALLLTCAQSIIQHSLLQSEEDAHLINLSGRQRMLSQSLTKNAYLQKLKSQNLLTDPAFQMDLKLWQDTHQRLLGSENDFSSLQILRQTNSGIVEELDQAMQALESCLMMKTNSCVTDLQPLEKFEAAYLQSMNQIVFALDKIATGKIRRVRAIEIILFVISLLTLLVEAYWIFRPSIRSLTLANHKIALKQISDDQRLSYTLFGNSLASLAHEITNPLTYAQTNLELLQDAAAKPRDAAKPTDEASLQQQEILQGAFDGINRSVMIIDRMRSLGSLGHQQKHPVSLRTAASAAMQFLQLQIPRDRSHRVKFINDLPQGLCLQGTEIDWFQIFSNVFQNSLDAIDRKKDLQKSRDGHELSSEHDFIRVTAIKADDSTSNHPASMATGSAFVLQIEDTGCGLMDMTSAQAMQAFFTSKIKSKGGTNGLGLSIVTTLLQEYGAKGYFDQTVKTGAKLIITIPGAAEFGTATEEQA